MAKSLLGALLGFVLAVSLAVAQDKTSPTGGEKTAGEKTAPDKAGTSKTGDAKTGDTKTADTKQPPKVHEKTATFNKLRDELRETIERLGKIQEKYRLVKPEGRPALEEEFEVRKAQAKKLLPQVTEAAKAAIVVDPTDPELIDYLGALAKQAHEKRSAHEEAADLARLILDHQPTWDKFRRPELFRIGGVAAFYTAQYDTAEKYLKELEKHTGEGSATAADCREKLTAERAHWQEELERQKAEKKPEGDPQALPRVRLTTTQGDIVVELFDNEAPNTVANFITLVEKKFYDGKLLESFRAETSTGAVDASDKDKDMDYKIACEWTRPNFRRHFRGSLAMSIPEGKDTGCSRFSIWLEPIRTRDPTVKDNQATGGSGTVFGRVVSGMDVMSKVRQAVQTSSSPQPDKIVHATVLNRKDHKYEVQKLVEKAKPETTPKTGTTPDGKTEPAPKTPK
jgi:cyclophilin family peptidyl-prolyl cis-trans isomerase